MNFKVFKRLFNSKMHKEQSVHEYCMKVIKDIEELGKLELDMQKKLQDEFDPSIPYKFI